MPAAISGQERTLESTGTDNDFDFQARKPCAALAPFVRQHWYARGRIDYRRDHILPNGCAVLLINLGDPHLVAPAVGSGPADIHRDAWLCGVQTRALVNEPLGETHVVGVTFAPAGASAFFRPPMSALADDVIALDGLWGSGADQLRQRLLDTNRVDGKLACLERALLARTPTAQPRLVRLEAALRRLLVPGPAGIASVADYVELSPKQLIAEFHRFVGVTPGTLARISRLNRLLGDIEPGPTNAWAELAAGHGWSDQAHLIRDFKRFSGVTPTEYVRRRARVFGPDLETGEEAIFLPDG
jgi:AraC-like DNA-binding protein